MPLSSKQFRIPKTWFFSVLHSARSPCHRPVRLYNVSYLIRRKYAPPAKSATGQLAHLIEILSLSLGATNLFMFQDQTVFPHSITSSRITISFSPGKTPPFPPLPLSWAMLTQTLRIIWNPGFQPAVLGKCRGDVCLLDNWSCSQPASHFIQPINTNRSHLHAASLGL